MKYIINSKVVSEKIDEDIVICLNGYYFILKNTSILIWELIVKGKEFDEIIDCINRSYSDDINIIREAVITFIRKLFELNILQYDNDNSSYE